MTIIKNTDVMQSYPYGGMNMKKVSFIFAKWNAFHFAKKAFMLGIVLVAMNLLPLPTTPFLSNNILVAEAKETDADTSIENIRLNIKSEMTLVTEDVSALRVYNLPEGYNVSFKSSNAEVVAVEKESDTKAILTGKGVGTAEVTVTVKTIFWKVKTMRIQVVVGPPAQSVKFVEPVVLMKVGDKTTLRALLKPSNTVEKGKYESSDSSIASVTTSTGCVTAKEVGTVTITIVTASGATDTCTIEVTEAAKTAEE